MAKSPQHPDSLRDLDGDGDIDAGDNRIHDLDNDGRIDAEDREIHDLDNDNDIDAQDREIKNKLAEEEKERVGSALGRTKGSDGKWQKAESQKQDQPVNKVTL